jgi:kynurenine formamidase
MRWKNRPEGSNWGEFGPDDEVGRLNLITAEKVRQGVAEVRDGRCFCLSMPLDYPGGNILNASRHPPQRLATVSAVDGTPRYLFPLSKGNPYFTDVVCDDRVLLHTQYSSQWDALSHVGAEFDADGDGVDEIVFYNGWRGGEHIVLDHSTHSDGASGECSEFEGAEARRLGIEKMAERCVQGRGVLIDLHAIHGDGKVDVGFAELEAAMQAQSVTVERGDMVCFHTGFARKVMAMNRQPSKEVLDGSCAALDGRDPKLQEWVHDSGVAVLIADNYAVERFPSPSIEGRHALLPLHELCLFKLGIHLGELWYLSELADYLRAAGRNRFLLTAPPLRLPGAVGSPVTAIATV